MRPLLALVLLLSACGPEPERTPNLQHVECCACLSESEFLEGPCLDILPEECVADIADGKLPGLDRCWIGGDHCHQECGAIYRKVNP